MAGLVACAVVSHRAAWPTNAVPASSFAVPSGNSFKEGRHCDTVVIGPLFLTVRPETQSVRYTIWTHWSPLTTPLPQTGSRSANGFSATASWASFPADFNF